MSAALKRLAKVQRRVSRAIDGAVSMEILRPAVFERAEDSCESCGAYIDDASGRMDHFFGRAKATQSVANCWALCLACDTHKTISAPSAAWWLGQFILHATKHGFTAEAERAGAKLQTLRAKGLVAA